MAPEEVSPLAIASLALSCLGALSFGLISVVGVICGVMAKRRIESGSCKGYPLAQAGIIVGSVVIVFWVVMPVLFFGGMFGISLLERLVAGVPRLFLLGLLVVLTGVVVVPFLFLKLSKRKESQVWRELSARR